MNKPTIFISMASQDDEETKYAIQHAFKNAKFPERVFLGVGLTCLSKKYLKEIELLAKENSHIKIKYVKQKKNDLKTIGIGQGRTRAASLYDNQDYMLQIDCHSYLDKNWDTKLIDYFLESQKLISNKKNHVISCIPPIYSYNEKETVIKVDDPKTRYGTYIPNSFFVKVVPKWTEVDIINISSKKFVPAHKLNPACVFGDKEFGKNPGICETAIFYDEDWTQQINLFGRGFAFVFPNVEDFPVRHLDADHISKKHDRMFLTEYLSKNKSIEMHELLVKNYVNFISLEKNQKAIQDYRSYSKADAQKGYFSNSSDFIPKEF